MSAKVSAGGGLVVVNNCKQETVCFFFSATAHTKRDSASKSLQHSFPLSRAVSEVRGVFTAALSLTKDSMAASETPPPGHQHNPRAG